MQHQEAGLIRLSREDLNTPIYVKVDDRAPWPPDDVFFLLTGDGLFLCRNHAFFISSVPAPNPPSGLGRHRAFLKTRYPKIPRRLFERAVGFFHAIYKRHGSEAGLLLVWNGRKKRMRLVCPDQVAIVSRSWSRTHPIGLFYKIPDLGGDLLIGDLHSHGNESAYASFTDKKDEKDRAGIHVVVGRMGDIDVGGDPDLHLELVIDGARFSVASELILEGYTGPCSKVPPAWLEQVKVESYGTASGDHGGRDGGGVDDGHDGDGPRAWEGHVGPGGYGRGGDNNPKRRIHGSSDPPSIAAEEHGNPDPETGRKQRD
jgi:PRTRC genetic system protein A